MEERMISVSEASKRSGMHPQTIRDGIKAGRIAGYKSGNVFLVDSEALKSYKPVGHCPKGFKRKQP